MSPTTEMQASQKTARRNTRFDLLRLIALVAAIGYQWFGWSWTPVVIPFSALTFAIAGALMATSLDRTDGHPWIVLAKRMRRVIVPVWGLAAVAVPLMVWHSSAAGGGAGIGTSPGWSPDGRTIA